MNHYPRHIGDYLRDTAHLSLLEHGVYGRLLDMYYLADGPLAMELADICRKIGARSLDEKEAVSAVLAEFFQCVDGAYHHRRADREIARYREFGEKQRARALKRYTPKPAAGMPPAEEKLPPAGILLPPACPRDGMPARWDANHKPRTKNQEPILPLNPPSRGEASRTDRKRRRMAMPKGWTPNAHHHELASQHGKDASQEAQSFADWHAARGNVFSDWDRAFNSWLRKSFTSKSTSKTADEHRSEKRAGEYPEQIKITIC